MEWKKVYLDLALVPPSLLLLLGYHMYLWYRVINTPLLTITGVNSVGRRLWVQTMIEDTDKKNIVAVQTMRNMIMASTLVGTISILLSTGLAAVMSSTYSNSVKTQAVPVPSEKTTLFLGGHHSEVLVAVKYVTPLLFLLLSFFCTSLSIGFLNQVNYLINIPAHEPCLITAEYVSELFEKGCVFNMIATRNLYIACPLLMWILGPVPVLLCSVALLPLLYNLDFLYMSHNKSAAALSPSLSMVEYYRIM